MTLPIYRMLDAIDWTSVDAPEGIDPDGLYATHQGVLEIGDVRLKAYTLNDGRRILDAADVLRFFGEDPDAVLGAER